VQKVALAVIALALFASPAWAAPATRLVYAREPGAEKCADEGALRSAVAARLGYDPFFPWAKTTPTVNVRREGGAYRAHVALIDDKGLARGTRDLADTRDDCAELLPAMALGISIALDMLDPRPPAPPPPEPPKPPEPEPQAIGALAATLEKNLPAFLVVVKARGQAFVALGQAVIKGGATIAASGKLDVKGTACLTAAGTAAKGAADDFGAAFTSSGKVLVSVGL
jgi:hypothetical protein